MKRISASILLVSLVSLASSSSAQPVLHASSHGGALFPAVETPLAAERALFAAPQQDETRHRVVRLEVFHQDLELGELDFDYDDQTIFVDGPSKDVDKTRIGLRAAFGGDAARGYIQLFGEDYGKGSNETEGWGIGGGVRGVPSAHDFSDDVRLIIPYRAGINVVYGDEDDGLIETALGYLELEAELGIGGYFFGAQPSIGAYMSSLYGAGTVESQAPALKDDFTFDGTNIGAYGELLYEHDDFPLFGRVRIQTGDVEGIVVSIGATF